MKKTFRILAVVLAATMLMCCCAMAVKPEDTKTFEDATVSWYANGIYATGESFLGSTTGSCQTTAESTTSILAACTFWYYPLPSYIATSTYNSTTDFGTYVYNTTYPNSQHNSVYGCATWSTHEVNGSTNYSSAGIF